MVTKMVTKVAIATMKWLVMLELLLMASCSVAEEDLPSAEAITLVVRPEDIERPPKEEAGLQE